MSNEQSEWPRILHIAHCTLLIAHSGARFHARRFMVPKRGQSTMETLHEPSHPERARSPGAARDQDRRDGTLRALGCGRSAASRDGSRSGSWRQLTSRFWRCSLPMNRLVTCHLSLVTGDLEKLIRSVALFSISSYQLPVTSYQLPV